MLESKNHVYGGSSQFAIDRASDKELLGLQEYVYQMENCTDPEKTASLIFEFSHEIAYISGNTLAPTLFCLVPRSCMHSGSATDKNMATKELILQ